MEQDIRVQKKLTGITCNKQSLKLSDKFLPRLIFSLVVVIIREEAVIEILQKELIIKLNEVILSLCKNKKKIISNWTLKNKQNLRL